MNDFFPAVEAAKEAGITHFEFGRGIAGESVADAISPARSAYAPQIDDCG
jgi:hypothetical protein